ncbi:MAG: DegV family EDD domain-containing protein, partial [Lachnospiraceae bacterium]|nr:DegV family EDD domain-containing protein [Lachnospiraceae bacterium]
LYFSMLSVKKSRFIFLFCEAIVACLCWQFGYLHPESFPRLSRETILSNAFFSLIILIVVIVLLITYQSEIFHIENERFVAQKQEIESLNAVQNRFFSSMSHELRTPINTIIGLTEMIMRENVSPDVKEDAEYINSASNILLHLVNDILDVSKLKTGQMHLMIAPYHMGQMLSEIIGMLTHQAREKGLLFEVDVAEDVPTVLLGDEIRIKQILINVLNNSIKYTEEGSVLLSVQSEQKNEVETTILFSISDTGIGIRKESIPHLFTAFSRVDESKNRYIEGTGLGLSIVKQFVDMMNGSITVNSVYTKGTTFLIEIPQEIVDETGNVQIDLERKADSLLPQKHHHSFEAPHAKVLMVDDTQSNLIVFQKMLRDTKVQIQSAESGQEALRKTQTNTFDVIFMDHMMPEMDGIECMHRIRTQVGGKSKEAKIVAFTANADDENRLLYEREGFDGFLVKPVSAEDLEYELYRLLPGELLYSKTIADSETPAEDSFARISAYRKKTSVAITTESVASIPRELREKYQISIIPYTISTEEGNFKDRLEIETDDALSYMDLGKRIHSAPPEVEAYEEFFADCLTRSNNVIHISSSSQINQKGYVAAQEASQAFDNIFVVDCEHLSAGMAYLVIEAGRMVRSGMNATDILFRLNTLKNRIRTYFMTNYLDQYIGDSGKPSLFYKITQAFMIYPVSTITQGRISVKHLFMGSRERVWRKYIALALRSPGNIDPRILYITYAGLTWQELEWIQEQVAKKVIFKRVLCHKVSPTLAIRYGTGSFGLMFLDNTK